MLYSSFIFIAFFFSFKSFAHKNVSLKSLKHSPVINVKSVTEIDCEFSGQTVKGQKLLFKSEKFLLTELRNIDEIGNKGVYVNVFDFFGYRFHINDSKKLVIRAEIEESLKKVTKDYSRLPASFSSKVSFSTNVNNKSINFKEVTVVCH